MDKKSGLPLYDILANGIVPEFLIRAGIRHLLKQKLKQLSMGYLCPPNDQLQSFKQELMRYPIAIATDAANTQHYELPAEFFQNILGPQMKYSCCLWGGARDLIQAEQDMLDLTCQRAELADGQKILDLGCGWGSFSLYAAARYPNSHITAVSNSHSQKRFIENKMAQLKIDNVEVITSDINDLDFTRVFDRIVSVEMFEHVKNYQLLLAKIASWLASDGKLFVHIFCHVLYPYHFGQREDDWLAKYFFSGGTMPSEKLLMAFREDLFVVKQWRINGIHYHKTAEAWLANMQCHQTRLWQIIATTYGQEQARRWWNYWRLFFLACSEVWKFRKGEEWLVAHYLLEKVTR